VGKPQTGARQLANCKRFRRLTDQWIGAAIKLARLELKHFESGNGLSDLILIILFWLGIIERPMERKAVIPATHKAMISHFPITGLVDGWYFHVVSVSFGRLILTIRNGQVNCFSGWPCFLMPFGLSAVRAGARRSRQDARHSYREEMPCQCNSAVSTCRS